MARYDIYVMDESELLISGGRILDGVNQGDGSHLQGATITFTSSNWQPVAINDDDDDFRDNDSGQRFDGAQTVNGVTYASDTQVEAEYGITLTDGTNTWTLVGFNVRDSNPSYATIEGLALVDSPQGPPPIGVPLTVSSTFEGPNFQSAQYFQPICFATGTLIDTPHGPIPVEAVREGMTVETRDHGPRRVLWTGQRRVIGTGSCAPVRLPAGMMGNDRDVVVSQQHRLLLTDWRAELFFGVDEVLVAAKFLVGLHGIIQTDCAIVGYHHLLLEDHAVLRASGTWSESLCVGSQAMASLPAAAQHELETLFPELIGRQTAYPSITRTESALLRRAA